MKTDYIIPHCGSKAQRLRLAEALYRMQAPRDRSGLAYLAFVGWLCVVFVAGWVTILLWM